MSIARPEDVPAAAFAPPMDNEIREQLARIRSSPAFDAPDRAQKFLCYVVEEALQGRADRIKAYSIAIEVFHRDASFDAQNDPVVRIEAGRVRRALEHYYLLTGQKDPILITIPKGGYVPIFSRVSECPVRADEQVAQARPSMVGRLAVPVTCLVLLGVAGWALADHSALRPFSSGGTAAVADPAPGMPKVIIAPFEDITGTPGSALLTRGLNDEVIGQMAQFKEINILAGDAATEPVKASPSGSDLPLYRLEGRIRLDADRLRFSVRLVDRDDGVIIWTKTYDAELGRRELFDIETEIAGEIAMTLAQPYGVIFQAKASEVLDNPSEDAKAYACALSYYGYRADLNRQTHAAVQGCLKEVVARYPNYATAWALLSLTYLDELRFRYRLDASIAAPIDLALQTAARAVSLDPGNVRALQAEMLADYFNRDVQNALAIGEKAYALNPNDTEFTGEYGFRLALSGQWERGCRLLSQTIARNPGPMDYFRSGMAVCAYMDRDYQAAERWARAADLPDNPIYHVILAAIYGQTGKMSEARQESGWLERNAPDYLTGIRKEVSARILRPQDQEHFIEGLIKAGFSVPAERSSETMPPAVALSASNG